MKKKLNRILRFPPARFTADVVRAYFGHRVSRAAAALAYSLTLTFFPIIICLFAFVQQLHLDMASIVDELSAILPGEVVSIFTEYLSYLGGNHSNGMFVIGAITAVFFASAAVRGLMHIMQEIYGRATFRGLRQLIASILFSLFLLVTVYLSMVVLVTGNWFFHLLGELLGLEDLAARFGVWQWLKYVLLLALVFLFILVLYRFAAPLEKPRPPVVPGALTAAAALVGASVLFSLIISGSTRYSLVYGSLASVVILLIWLYLCGNILILGCVTNFVIYSHRKERDSLRGG